MKTAGTFVFFFNTQGHILLCKRRDKDLWNLPGGRVEDGESPWDAALREVREEIGVTAQLERLTGVYHKPLQDEVVFQFLGTITEGTPTTSDEVADVRYFPPDALPHYTACRRSGYVGTRKTQQLCAFLHKRLVHSTALGSN